MARLFKLLTLLLLLSVTRTIESQSQPAVIAPNVFLRGIQLADGVRYTASIIKPTDDVPLRNVSVEITLPASATFTEMLISRQIEFDVIRRNSAGQLTLIWQISRVPADQPLDAFAFTVAQPLAGEVEFYVEWQDEQGAQFFQSFFEQPTLIVTGALEGQISLNQPGFQPVGSTGVQVAASSPAGFGAFSVRLLPVDFNPPAELGSLWWCSLLEVTGLPEGTALDVIVPLRRPLAPFTALALFHQQQDGTWQPLDTQAVVTADGQFAMYRHPGGVVATGVSGEAQPEIVPVEQANIVVADVVVPPQIEQPGVVNLDQVTDGTSNTIAIGEVPAATIEPPPAESPTQITDGSSNTIFNPESPLPTLAPTLAPPISDGSSNTILIGESTLAPLATSTNAVQTPTLAAINDGSSNTILIGENTVTPLPDHVAITPTVLSGNTVTPLPDHVAITPTVVSENTVTPLSDHVAITPTPAREQPATVIDPTQSASALPTTAITDGSSNTIAIGEGTAASSPAATSLPSVTLLPAVTDAVAVTPAAGDATLAGSPFAGRPTTTPTQPNPPLSVTLINATPTAVSPITDGSSNTILIGEATAFPTAASTSASQITDGSSNTISLGESTRPLATQLPSAQALPTRTSEIADGSSNTIPLGETTRTSTALPPRATSTTRPTPFPTPVFPNPFGSGGLRVVVLTSASGTVLQCQVGRVNCVTLARRPGGGFR